MKRFLVAASQTLAYCVLALPCRLIWRVNRIGQFTPRRGTKYVLAANHPTRFDPFFVILSLPPKTFFSLTPIRFVTAEEYLRNPLARMALVPLGCISTKPREGKVLAVLARKLAAGDSVFIFPGGMLESHGEVPASKVGVVYLERAVPDVQIVPVQISCSTLSWRQVLRRKFFCTVHFKEPFRHENFPKDLQPLADDVAARIQK